MYVHEWPTVSALTKWLFWCFPELRSNEGNKHQNNNRVNVETVHHESAYIILFPTRHNESINDDKTIFTHRTRVPLVRFSFCWWRHNRLLMTSQWPDNCDAITWTVISNLLDIDFIHGVINSQSCKKLAYGSLRGWLLVTEIAGEYVPLPMPSLIMTYSNPDDLIYSIFRSLCTLQPPPPPPPPSPPPPPPPPPAHYIVLSLINFCSHPL